MIDKTLKAILLNAVFINKGFVYGDENCNYEKYLLELINESMFFRKKSNYEEYKAPLKEDDKECDCVSQNYKIDFKLLASTTRLQASKELSARITNYEKGYTVYSSPRREGESITATRLHAALRIYKLKDLQIMDNNEYEYGTIEFDVKKYLEKLGTKKNLFLFLPYQFTFDNGKNYNFQYAIEKVKEAVENDFKVSNIYRQSILPQYDTYLSFIYDDNLIITEFQKDSSLKIVDVVFLFKSEVYTYLYNRYFFD